MHMQYPSVKYRIRTSKEVDGFNRNQNANTTEAARSNLELMNAACPFHSTAAAETLSSACTAKVVIFQVMLLRKTSSRWFRQTLGSFDQDPPLKLHKERRYLARRMKVCSSILSSDSEDDLNKMEDGEDPNDIGRLDSGEELEEDYIVDEEDAQVGNEDVGGEREEEGARTKGKEMIPI
ncbi:hypothetical protein PC118_g21972 [Phytophthora cactorum]|uniref:Uncharacterized protein n=1 Tax=Phytophthora cactorum TaxID=29920 RepID=A0A8T1F134_9STRA|nr:hypothetical protein PC118_g21972 [Phytophthora cactorum]